MRSQVVRAVLSLTVVGAMFAAGSAAVHAGTPARPSSSSTIGLASMLAADGTIRSTTAAGSVDMTGWQLTSNLAKGDAPRFTRTTAATTNALEVAAWSELGSKNGNGVLNGYVSVMAFFDGDLYIGGGFQNVAGDATADFIARWNGDFWSGVGSNGSGNGALNALVRAFCVLDGKLLVGGAFTNAGNGATADYLARWSGSAWSGMGSNGAGDGAFNDQVFAIATTGEDTFVGGRFTNASGNATADYGARWSGASWVAVDGSTTTAPFTSWVWSIAIYDQTFYFGGTFINAGGINEADWIVKLKGNTWSALGNRGPGLAALNGTVMSIVANGSNIYAGGQFTNAAGLAKADYVARWDGSAWHSLGSNGAGDGALNAYVTDLTLSNGYLYVSGDFLNAAGLSAADFLAVWKGSSWAALPANGGGAALNATGLSLLIDNGTLYVGSSSQNTSGIAAADFIASYWPLSEPTIKPDGMIKQGSAGTYMGDNVYAANAAGQTIVTQKAAGTKVTFYIKIQNDGSVSDSFTLRNFWTTAAGVTTRYYKGTTEITSKINAGTYVTPSLAPGASLTIKAVVNVGAGPSGPGTMRLVRISSRKDAAKVDSVEFVVQRS